MWWTAKHSSKNAPYSGSINIYAHNASLTIELFGPECSKQVVRYDTPRTKIAASLQGIGKLISQFTTLSDIHNLTAHIGVAVRSNELSVESDGVVR